MDQTPILPTIGTPVSLDALDVDGIDDMSVGELAYAVTLLHKKLAQRLANPDTFHSLATFQQASGADWAGHHDTTQHANDHGEKPPPPLLPIPPDNYCDSLPAIALLLQQQQRAHDAAMANLVRHLDAAMSDQTAYLGAPVGVKAFDNSKQFLRQTMHLSIPASGLHVQRAKHYAYAAGANPDHGHAAPKFPQLAASFAAGNISAENLDKITQFDTDLTKYTRAIGHTPDYKDEVLQAFEPTLVEAAETASPEELAQLRHRWVEVIAHHIDADGPPPSVVLKKQPDNALHDRAHPDGSGTVSMHMDPIWFAVFKELLTTNLNYNGNSPLLPHDIANLYHAATQAATAQNETQDAEAAEADGTDCGARPDR